MKKPFAYISAAWSGQEFTDTDQAVVYCRKVYLAGFTPICPILYLPHFLNDSIPAEHKDGIDMARELLRRSHVLIVCGDEVDEAVKNDMSAGNISKGNLLMIVYCMIWLRSRWKKPPSAWKPCWRSATYWRNFLRCSGGVSFSIFSTDTPIQRLPKCRTAINRRSCVPCTPP